MMLVRVEAGHTVLPERLAMMLVRVLRGGRPHGTTRDQAGYDVGQSGDRPHGTTREAGYDVGRSRGRPCGRSRTINFSGSIELPTEWDH